MSASSITTSANKVTEANSDWIEIGSEVAKVMQSGPYFMQAVKAFAEEAMKTMREENEKTNTVLKSSLTDLTEKVKTLESSNKTDKASLQALKERIVVVEKEKDQASIQSTALQAEMFKLKEQNALASQKLTEAASQTEALQNRIEDLAKTKDEEIRSLKVEKEKISKQKDGEILRLASEKAATAKEKDGVISRLASEKAAVAKQKDEEVSRLEREKAAAIKLKDEEIEKSKQGAVTAFKEDFENDRNHFKGLPGKKIVDVATTACEVVKKTCEQADAHVGNLGAYVYSAKNRLDSYYDPRTWAIKKILRKVGATDKEFADLSSSVNLSLQTNTAAEAVLKDLNKQLTEARTAVDAEEKLLKAEREELEKREKANRSHKRSIARISSQELNLSLRRNNYSSETIPFKQTQWAIEMQKACSEAATAEENMDSAKDRIMNAIDRKDAARATTARNDAESYLKAAEAAEKAAKGRMEKLSKDDKLTLESVLKKTTDTTQRIRTKYENVKKINDYAQRKITLSLAVDRINTALDNAKGHKDDVNAIQSESQSAQKALTEIMNLQGEINNTVEEASKKESAAKDLESATAAKAKIDALLESAKKAAQAFEIKNNLSPAIPNKVQLSPVKRTLFGICG